MIGFRYELRRGDEVVATGHLSLDEPLDVGDRVEIGGHVGIVRVVEPRLSARELDIVVQLLTEGRA
jgi:CheY-like chemotaxis protein